MRSGHIRQFAVRADSLRRGVGRAIIGRTLQDAARAGVEHLACASSLVAVDFYRSAGFVEIGRETVMHVRACRSRPCRWSGS